MGFTGITACGVLVALGLLAALTRGRLAARETLRAAVVTVSVAGVFGAAGNVAVLTQTPHVTAGSVAVQVAVVVVPLVLALVVTRWVGLRRAERQGPRYAVAT